MGLSHSKDAIQKARKSQEEARARVEAQFEHVDVIILPTMPIDAPARDSSCFILENTSYSALAATIRYTSLFNQTGHPVVCIPAFVLPGGRAVSIQLIGAKDDDKRLLAVAKKM